MYRFKLKQLSPLVVLSLVLFLFVGTSQATTMVSGVIHFTDDAGSTTFGSGSTFALDHTSTLTFSFETPDVATLTPLLLGWEPNYSNLKVTYANPSTDVTSLLDAAIYYGLPNYGPSDSGINLNFTAVDPSNSGGYGLAAYLGGVSLYSSLTPFSYNYGHFVLTTGAGWAGWYENGAAQTSPEWIAYNGASYVDVSYVTNDPPPAVPEPTTMLLLGLGLVGLAGISRKF